MSSLTIEAPVRQAHDHVDFWKIGNLNHNKEVGCGIDWPHPCWGIRFADGLRLGISATTVRLGHASRVPAW